LPAGTRTGISPLPKPPGPWNFAVMTLRPFVVLTLLAAAGALAAPPPLPTPEPGSAHWTTVNGHRLYYELHGSGRPLLLLHGGGGSIVGSWLRQIRDFAPTRLVILPEQVGHGHTPDVPGPFSYAGMTEDTAALLQQLHLKAVDVVGWSDGGIEALMLALRHPDLVRRVIATGANTTPAEVGHGFNEGMEHANGATFQDGAPNSVYALESPDGAAHAPIVGEKLKQLWMTKPGLDELTLAMLRQLRAPTVIMGGDHDVIPVEHLVAMWRAIPNAQLWILPDTGHATFLERPEWTDPFVLAFMR